MRVAVLDDYAGAALRLADWSGLDVTVFRAPLDDPARALRGFEVVCLMRERTAMPGALIRALPGLRLIVTSGPRNAAIDLQAAAEAGVVVSGTQSRKSPTAELAMLLVLALSRRLVPEMAALSGGGWQAGLGRDLAGLTLGMIGLGAIGGQVAALGRAFGMEVIAWSQNLTDARAEEVGVRRVGSLGALMAGADAASVHLVLSERTAGLIGAEALAAARPGLCLVNTSRGPIVQSGALLAWLERDPAAAAALDVHDVEPVPAGDPLRSAAASLGGRLVLTPHLGYATEETFRLFYRQTVAAIRAFRDGAPIRRLA